MVGYFTHTNNRTKCIVENVYCICFLVICKTIEKVFQANLFTINTRL